MLSITDLSAESTLERVAMSGLRGGAYLMPESFYGYFNGSTLDVGTHEAVQSQGVLVDQSGAVGGFSIAAASQVQNGVSGQFAL